jgi:hypothetical protein
MKTRFPGLAALLVLSAALGLAALRPDVAAQATPPAGRLAVVWTSGDPEVAHRMCLMYSHAAKTAGWFGEVQLIVWGPSARLLAADKDLQAKVAAMQKDGVVVRACVVCADSYGVTARLRELGLEVKPMGPPLTELLKADWKVLTF